MWGTYWLSSWFLPPPRSLRPNFGLRIWGQTDASGNTGRPADFLTLWTWDLTSLFHHKRGLSMQRKSEIAFWSGEGWVGLTSSPRLFLRWTLDCRFSVWDGRRTLVFRGHRQCWVALTRGRFSGCP